MGKTSIRGEAQQEVEAAEGGEAGPTLEASQRLLVVVVWLDRKTETHTRGVCELSH